MRKSGRPEADKKPVLWNPVLGGGGGVRWGVLGEDFFWAEGDGIYTNVLVRVRGLLVRFLSST